MYLRDWEREQDASTGPMDTTSLPFHLPKLLQETQIWLGASWDKVPPAFHPEIPVFCGTRPPGEVFQSHAPSLAVLLPPLPKMRLPMNQIKLIYYLQGRAPKRKAKLFCVYRTKPSLTFKPSIIRKSFFFCSWGLLAGITGVGALAVPSLPHTLPGAARGSTEHC